MSVIVRFGRRKAILCGARWTAADGGLEEKLNRETRQWLRETGGPPLGDGDPDYTTALAMGRAHGGRIQRHLMSGRASTREAYARVRQMELF